MKTIQVRPGIFSLLFSALLAYSPAGLAAVVNSCDEASLRAALAEGGTVTFTCDGTIVLTNTLTISENTILDASGRQVTISGGKAVRIFEVLSNVSLSLNHLTLAHGWAAGTNGTNGTAATAGQGGAVRVQGGTLRAVDCTFATNAAVGGKGTNISVGGLIPGGPGAVGEGGAVFAAFAVLRLTNCAFAWNAATGGAGGDATPGPIPTSGGDGGSSRGGSIYALSSQIVLAGGAHSNNAANPGPTGAGGRPGNRVNTWGGALYAENCTCTGVGLTWRGNAARAAAGACFLQAGEATFASCVFDGNGAAETPQTSGGAIRSLNARLGLVDCLLRNNTAVGMQANLSVVFGPSGSAAGGAVAATGGALGVTNCTFTGNLARGGDSALVGGPFLVVPAGRAWGGGLFHSGTGAVVNCTFVGNVAQHGWKLSPQASGGLGGGLASGTGALTVLFCTIASNLVSDSGNSASVTNYDPIIYSHGAGCYVDGGSLVLASSILAGNFKTLGSGSGTVPANTSLFVTDGGHNLSSDANPTFAVESSRSNTDPLLLPLADNGGPTPTMALRPDSPAINAGDSLSCPQTDQRGVARPQLGACDIGAYELPDGFYILALQDHGPDEFFLSGLGIPNQSYRVEFSENLSNWLDAASGFTGPDGVIGVEVDRGTQPQRFYRIAVP